MKSRIRNRAIRRRDERGATVFVVVLVLAMLTGIGLFAAQASSIATSTTGAARVSTQSRYFAETAMNSVMAKLSRDLGSHVNFLAKQNSKVCLGQLADPFYPQCSQFGRGYIEQELGLLLFQGYDEQTGAHGTLGRIPDTNADMLVEMNDLFRVDRPISGFDYTSAGAANVNFMSVMLHGTGRIRQTPAGGTARTLANTTFRAELIVGPVGGP
ncbi:MAG: pilus assembly PilX N-terminal domain-containing protein [Polyangiaceae bacterium]|nr:pilus assembly PilX N-terminal domain-containing protein [Polyangiaceae bacterium]